MAERIGPKKLERFHFGAEEALFSRLVRVVARIGKTDRAQVCRDALDHYLAIAEAAPDLKGPQLLVFLEQSRAVSLDQVMIFLPAAAKNGHGSALPSPETRSHRGAAPRRSDTRAPKP